MGIESDYIWYDGRLVPFQDATVHVLAHTLHYGLGAFEGIRAYPQPDGRPGIWRLDEHLDRFLQSMKMIRYGCAYSLEELRDACHDVLEANGLTEAYIRPIGFLGMGKMGLGARDNPVHIVVAAWQWGAYLGEEGVNRGIRVKTSSFARSHPNAWMQRAKLVGAYVNSILARYEANDDGYDEALLLDHNGYVAEGTGENVFVVKGNTVMTPPVLNILPGLTRKTIIELLHDNGLEVKETLFARDAFYVADEAFFVGTAAEVTPIREVDHRVVGKGDPGPITRELQGLYAASVRGLHPPMTPLISRRD